MPLNELGVSTLCFELKLDVPMFCPCACFFACHGALFVWDDAGRGAEQPDPPFGDPCQQAHWSCVIKHKCHTVSRGLADEMANHVAFEEQEIMLQRAIECCGQA